jgi:tetratricopeptide (TPR) repeat protein
MRVIGVKEENIEQAITTFRTVLQRAPQDPYRWVDLGDAFLEAGQKEDARYCFGQVLALAPRTAVLLLRVADFHFQIGENQEALPITARILGLIPNYDSVIFNDYIRNVDQTEDVLRFGLPEDRRAAKSWLRFLMQGGRLGDAQRTWDWVVSHWFADNAVAGEYADFLIRQGHPDSAASSWAQYMGARADDYDKSTYLFNGDFESEPAQSPFDWNVARTEGVEVTRDCTPASSGKCSLRISFAGTQNLGFAAASQLAFVRPGTYRFHAFIRTEALTTDQGIRFQISDAEARARLDETFGQFTGSTPWIEVEHDLFVPSGTRLLQIQVIRQGSMKFDNKVSGTAWINALKLEPIRSVCPPACQQSRDNMQGVQSKPRARP